jgi:hypothetical protein
MICGGVIGEFCYLRKSRSMTFNRSEISQFRNQLYAIEKAIKIMRANLELAIQKDPAFLGSFPKLLPVNTSLESLLGGHRPFGPKAVMPYEEFVNGVCCSFDNSHPETRCTVQTIAFQDEIQNGQAATGSSCLSITLTHEPGIPVDSLYLETELDFKALRLVHDLKVTFVPSIRVADIQEVDNFSLFLRLYFGKEPHQDFAARTFPTLGTPLSFNYEITSQQFGQLPLDKATGARLVFRLPTRAGDQFELLMSSFAATGSKE